MTISPAKKQRKNAASTPREPRRTAQRLVTVEGTVAMSPEEAWALYDEQARRRLGISADDFDRLLARGPIPDEDAYIHVSMFRCTRP